MIERRDVIKFGAGCAIGTAFTPIPWKLLDDTAIWSQNWSWIPKTPRGEVSVRYSTCTLCPGGCGVRAKCVAGHAVGIEGVGDHPQSRGAMCPVAFGGHCAPYHPRRIQQRIAVPETVAAAVARGPFAILDLGPRRAVSSLYAEAAKAKGGTYLRVPDRDEAFLDVLAERYGRELGSFGVDLEHARTLISFGAPVLESWGTPGRVLERWRSGELQVIQVDGRQSRTALAAHRWVRLVKSVEDLGSFGKPAVVVGHDDPERIADLNVELGSIGSEGGIVPRRKLPFDEPAARDLASIGDGSLAALFIDASRAYDVIPWPVIRRKLAPNAVVVAFAYKQDALTAHANVVLPVSAPFETIDDVCTPPCSAAASYATAPALIDAPVVIETPVDHLNGLLGLSLPSVDEVVKSRVAAVEAAGRGKLAKFGDSVVWTDDLSRASFSSGGALAPQRGRAEARSELKLALQIQSSRASDVTPLETKLDQESALYTPASFVRINPATARDLNLSNAAKAIIQTNHGSATRQILLDPAVPPGVIEASATPAADDLINICTDGAPGDWRSISAAVRRA